MRLEALRDFSSVLVIGGTAFLLAFLLTPIVRAVALRYGWVSRPLQERWGRRVTARLGGVAMVLSFLGTTLLWLPLQQEVTALLIGVALVALLGLVDDLRRLPPYTKLVGQLLIGCLVVLAGVRINLIGWAWLSIPLSVLWFVLLMNAFNLLDNMDGLAAGIGALAAGLCLFHAAREGEWLVASLSASIGGACLGFLRFNFPPAKIYMGDTGSHFIGLSLATLALLGPWSRSTQLMSVLTVPVFVLAVPIFDTCFVTIQRLRHGQHPFTGGKDHVSHRLAILGLSARQTALALYVVSALLGFLGIVSVDLRPLQAAVVWLLVLTVLVLLGRYLSQVKVYRIEPQPAMTMVSEPTVPATFIETMLLHKRRLLEILVDFSLISSAYVLAYLLRFEGALSGDLQRLILQSLPLILVVKIACFAGCGLYRGVWRYFGLWDVIAMFKAVILGSVLSSLGVLYLWRFEGYSRAVFVIDGMLTFLAVAGSRVVERLLDGWISTSVERRTPVLILGAGDTGARVLRSLHDARPSERRVIGFLDDDARKWGDRIHGVPVLGSRTRLAELLEAERVREVLIAISDPPGDLLQYIQRCCEPRHVAWRVVIAGVATPHA